MKRFSFVFFFILVWFAILDIVIVSCSSATQESNHYKDASNVEESSELNHTGPRQKIKAITNYGSLSYFVFRGEPMGYQYELLKSCCDYLNVELELFIEKDLVTSIEKLKDGKVDLLAMGLTMTNGRRDDLLFTDPLLFSRQVIVQRKPEGWRKMKTADEINEGILQQVLSLAGKTVYVERGTIFEYQLNRLSDEIADHINVISDERSVEELISAVSTGEIDYTVADEHVAMVNARYFPDIDVNLAISFPQKIAWATNAYDTILAISINEWLDQFNQSLRSRLLYNKYFRNTRSGTMVKSHYNSYLGDKLSPYDSLIMIGAEQLGWDWRLLASLIYQESEFKPDVTSWVGAYGLMQLMPEVMNLYGIDTLSDESEQIMAGVKHLIQISEQLPPEISDSANQILFTMAAYNAGLGHILDARRLASKYDLNPDVWFGNTEKMVLKLSDSKYYNDDLVYYGYLRGDETYYFVKEINDRYGHYRNLINARETQD